MSKLFEIIYFIVEYISNAIIQLTKFRQHLHFDIVKAGVWGHLIFVAPAPIQAKIPSVTPGDSGSGSG